jgi:molecular chaperone GrpE
MEDMSTKGKAPETASQEKTDSPQAETSPAEAIKRKRKTSVEDLKKSLDEQKQLAQNNYEKFLRAYAELENYKKRIEKEKAENLKYANETLLRDLLPFIDNLQRAMEHALSETNNNPKALIEGVQLTLADLMRVLEKHGLEPIESLGKPFDPSLHEAMMQVESDVHEPQTVVEEFQKGYLIRDRLLRPARVSVAMRPEAQQEKRVEGEAESPPEDHGIPEPQG